MVNEVVALVQDRATAAVKRAVTPAAFALIAALFLLFAIAALFAALFYWLEPAHGAVVAALICAAVAIVLGLIALAPLAFGRRKPPPPPPRAASGVLPLFVGAATKSASRLTPRQMLVAAALIGAALVLTARDSGKK